MGKRSVRGYSLEMYARRILKSHITGVDVSRATKGIISSTVVSMVIVAAI
jgi:hypothetical protein